MGGEKLGTMGAKFVDLSQWNDGTAAPEAKAGCVSRIFFFWVLDFARRAWHAIDEEVFTIDWLAKEAPVPSVEMPHTNIQRMKLYWEREMADKGNDANLFIVICKMISGILTTCLTVVTVATLTNMCGTVWDFVLVKSIGGEYSASLGYLAAALKTFAAAANSTMLQQSQHLLSREGRRIWLGLTGLIYSKPASLDSQSWGDLTEGELCNMLAVDSQQVIQGSMFFGMFAASPLYMLFPLICLPYFLGWPFAVGAAFYVLSMTYSNTIAMKNRDLHREKMEHADSRMSLTNEIFQGIRTVKLNGWEEIMEARVAEIRDRELKALRKIFVWQAWQSCVTGAVLSTRRS
jgi:ABC-type multidrug transport system fused ATPase/permease subunit